MWSKTRYKYWHILVGFICIGVGGYLIYLLVVAINPEAAPKKVKVRDPNDYRENGLVGFYLFFYYVTLMYISLNLFYHLINTRKKFYYFLAVSAILLLAILIYKTVVYYTVPRLLDYKYSSIARVYRSTLISFIPYIIISILFPYLTYIRESLKHRRILEAQKLQLEAQISQANFNFLKAQINPHFLHNTLNFLYAKALPHSPDLSEGILILSDIMRYALSKGNQKDGKALIADEIEHMKNVIKISQLRYSNTLKVNFEVKGEIEGKLIIPFVLITLVENALMHGDLKNEEHPLEIRLNVKGNELFFVCRNKKRVGPKHPSTGLGLENIQRRLELAYGTKYKFKIMDEAEFYTAELNIYEL
jgi:two-component system LytT family sensor kinase